MGNNLKVTPTVVVEDHCKVTHIKRLPRIIKGLPDSGL